MSCISFNIYIYIYTLQALLMYHFDFNKNSMCILLYSFLLIFILLTALPISLRERHLCHFRSQAELDRYLEASQIRERAIERINSVIGTYGPIVCTLYFFWDLLSVVSLFGISLTLMCFLDWIILCLAIITSMFFSRYNDLRLRIFSKYPDLFPDEVIISYIKHRMKVNSSWKPT